VSLMSKLCKYFVFNVFVFADFFVSFQMDVDPDSRSQMCDRVRFQTLHWVGGGLDLNSHGKKVRFLYVAFLGRQGNDSENYCTMPARFGSGAASFEEQEQMTRSAGARIRKKARTATGSTTGQQIKVADATSTPSTPGIARLLSQHSKLLDSRANTANCQTTEPTQQTARLPKQNSKLLDSQTTVPTQQTGRQPSQHRKLLDYRANTANYQATEPTQQTARLTNQNSKLLDSQVNTENCQTTELTQQTASYSQHSKLQTPTTQQTARLPNQNSKLLDNQVSTTNTANSQTTEPTQQTARLTSQLLPGVYAPTFHSLLVFSVNNIRLEV
ncbi:hypothetical protein J6590_062637, partial [Homalodisca vitripennis]